MKRDWGKVLVGTRLEKAVNPGFFQDWSFLITRGLKSGDGFTIISGQVAHQALNQMVREFLKTEMDSLLSIDSDAEFGWDLLHQMRNLEEGQEYDALQAFYTRRGWPPEAIWFKTNALGETTQCVVAEDPCTEDVALVGTHCALFRRHVFEEIYEQEGKPNGIPLEDFQWFYYPRHIRQSEDGAFSTDMLRHGYRLGATTVVKVGHHSDITTGWTTYQEYLDITGLRDQALGYQEDVRDVAKWLKMDPDLVAALSMQGSKNVRDEWEKTQPGSAPDVRAFYGRSDSGYFFDLISWNSSPYYYRLVAPLAQVEGERVLVIGPGIGGEIKALLKNKNIVHVYELPGALRDFVADRFGDEIEILTEKTFPLAAENRPQRYDRVVAFDVIEHVHPDEIENFLWAIEHVLKPNGKLSFHNNFEQQELYPMHYDHKEIFDAWIDRVSKGKGATDGYYNPVESAV